LTEKAKKNGNLQITIYERRRHNIISAESAPVLFIVICTLLIAVKNTSCKIGKNIIHLYS